jgi:hypothetical protein
MKIKIGTSLREGIQVFKKNPVLLVPLIGIAIVNYFVGQYVGGIVQKALGAFAPAILSGAGAQVPTVPTPFTPPGALPPGAAALPNPGELFASLGPVLGQISVITLVVGLITFILWLMTIRMISDAKGGKVNMNEALGLAVKKFIPLAISSLLYTLMVFAGLIVFIIPGIFLAIRFTFYPSAGMIDGKGIISSLGESWRVTKGNFWRMFGLGAATFAITVVLGLIAAVFPAGVASQIASVVLGFIASAWSIGAYTVAYLQAREGDGMVKA